MTCVLGNKGKWNVKGEKVHLPTNRMGRVNWENEETSTRTATINKEIIVVGNNFFCFNSAWIESNRIKYIHTQFRTIQAHTIDIAVFIRVFVIELWKWNLCRIQINYSTKTMLFGWIDGMYSRNSSRIYYRIEWRKSALAPPPFKHNYNSLALI